MNLSLFLSLAFAHLVAVTSPGPDFFYVIKSNFEKGLRSSIISSVGIGFGVFLHCLFAIVGLDFLYQKIPSNRYSWSRVSHLFRCWWNICRS